MFLVASMLITPPLCPFLSNSYVFVGDQMIFLPTPPAQLHDTPRECTM
jgi:hypothetical protein